MNPSDRIKLEGLLFGLRRAIRMHSWGLESEDEPDLALDVAETHKAVMEGMNQIARRSYEEGRDAALEPVRALHHRYTYYELEDSCPDTSEAHREEHHHESEDIGEFYCDQLPTGDVCCASCMTADGERLEWPCPTIRAIEPKETKA